MDIARGLEDLLVTVIKVIDVPTRCRYPGIGAVGPDRAPEQAAIIGGFDRLQTVFAVIVVFLATMVDGDIAVLVMGDRVGDAIADNSRILIEAINRVVVIIVARPTAKAVKSGIALAVPPDHHPA